MTNPAYELAKKEIGVVQWKDGHNPKILKYFGTVGHDWVKDDETAWCAAFVGAMLEDAGYTSTGSLAARSYGQWGDEVSIKNVKEGDIVVMWRGSRNSWQGHVGFVQKVFDGQVFCLGGNQSNAVNVSRYPIDRVLSFRTVPVIDKAVADEHIARLSWLEERLREIFATVKSRVRK